jgi:hypothetical protein
LLAHYFLKHKALAKVSAAVVETRAVNIAKANLFCTHPNWLNEKTVEIMIQ